MKTLLLFLCLLLAPIIGNAQGVEASRIRRTTVANLGTPSDSSVRYVTDGTPNTVPCTGGGTGAFAERTFGVWVCKPATAGGGGITNITPLNGLPKSIDGSGNLGASQISDDGSVINIAGALPSVINIGGAFDAGIRVVDDNATHQVVLGDVFGNGNGTTLTVDDAAQTITASNDLRVTTAGTNAASVPTLGSTSTFTNKTLTSPLITISLVTGSTTFALLNTTATTVNAFGAATTVNTGAAATQIWNFGGSTTASEFRFLEPSGSGTNYSAFKAVAQGANITYSLPPTVGAAGTFLTDVAGNGVLTWAAPAGSGTINAGVTNVIPKYTASTTIDDSLLADDGTTLNYTGAGGISTAPGTGVAGTLTVSEGTSPGLSANTVRHAAAADAPAAGSLYLWGAAAGSGILRVANSSGTMTVTQDAGISHLAASSSADLRGVLSDENGTGAALFSGATSPVFVTPTLGVASATSLATSAASPLLLTNGQLVTIALTSQTTGGTTLTIPDFASVADEFTFKTKAQTMSNKTFVAPALGTPASGLVTNLTGTLTNIVYDAEGTGNTLTTVQKSWFAGAGCNNATASSFWDLGTSLAPTPTCKNSSSGAAQSATLDFPDSDGMFFAQVTQMLPADFTGTADAKVRWFAAATSGDVIWNVSTICVADAEVDNPAFNTVSTVTDTAKGTTLQMNDATITGVTITGCAAGENMHLKISRDRTTSGDTITGVVSFQGLELTFRRAQ